PLKRLAGTGGGFLAGKLGGLGRNLFTFFFDLFVVGFALFFFFCDGDDVGGGVGHLIPFDPTIQEAMVHESKELIFASVAVGLLIAAIQGALGGLAFAIAGIGAGIFWGVLMGFFSLVPVVGSALIWVPTAIWLAVTGHLWKGLT